MIRIVPHRDHEYHSLNLHRSLSMQLNPLREPYKSGEAAPVQPRTQSLFSSDIVAIADVQCGAPRSGSGPERIASSHHVCVVRTGVFIKHGPAHPRRGLVADSAHALFFNRLEPFRISHPTSRGDAITNLAFPERVISEVATRYAPDSVTPDVPFPLTHTIVPPAALVRLYQLRRQLRSAAGCVNRLEAEEEALSFLDAILRNALLRADRPRLSDRVGRAARRAIELAEATKEALSKQPAADTSLSDLALYLDVSPFHLARTFHQVAGLPIHQYLLRLRLTAALDRLADPNVRLGRVALDLGFSSPSHFTTAFRKMFGSPPRVWR